MLENLKRLICRVEEEISLWSFCKLDRLTSMIDVLSMQNRALQQVALMLTATMKNVSDCLLQYNEKHFSQEATLVSTWARKTQNESDANPQYLSVNAMQMHNYNTSASDVAYCNNVAIAANQMLTDGIKGMLPSVLH
jgi:hypothetical protein